MAMFDVERLVEECRAGLRESAPEVAVRTVVERAMAQPADIELALGTPTMAQITTLHHSPELTILNVIWAPGMAIYPHDHRMWAVIGLYGGREDNVFYRRTAHGLQAAGSKPIEARGVALLGTSIIHAVTNPLRQFTGAIHVYGGDFFAVSRSEWDPATLQERPYDVERARQVFKDANARWLAEAATARAESR
jgi:predicted metal-dependent enzyme (double-stranded beta helix superfamily)